MGYTPQQWSDLNPDFPASATRFAYMEGGIKDASDRLDRLTPASDGAQVGQVIAVAEASGGTATRFEVAEYFKVLAGNPDLLIAGTITRDANGAATSAPVAWPDGTPGTYTADTVSTVFPGTVDAYHITYGSPVTLTYTQPAVTRDSNGTVTARPAITVA